MLSVTFLRALHKKLKESCDVHCVLNAIQVLYSPSDISLLCYRYLSLMPYYYWFSHSFLLSRLFHSYLQSMTVFIYLLKSGTTFIAFKFPAAHTRKFKFPAKMDDIVKKGIHTTKRLQVRLTFWFTHPQSQLSLLKNEIQSRSNVFKEV